MSREMPPRSGEGRGWRWVALVLLVAAYVQGGLDKAFDFPAAVAEMRHFGLEPSALLAVATIDWQEIVHRRSMDLTLVRTR